MGCMSAYYALAAVLHALPIGGTQKNSLDQQLCSMLIDGSATGLFFSILGYLVKMVDGLLLFSLLSLILSTISLSYMV